MKAMIKCKMCGKKADLGFVLDNGKVINVCNDCIAKLGAMKSEEEKAKFFIKLTEEDK